MGQKWGGVVYVCVYIDINIYICVCLCGVLAEGCRGPRAAEVRLRREVCGNGNHLSY